MEKETKEKREFNEEQEQKEEGGFKGKVKNELKEKEELKEKAGVMENVERKEKVRLEEKAELTGIVRAICISSVRGVEKKSIGEGHFVVGFGIEGDAHGGNWHRQVSLLSYDKVAAFNERGANVEDGAFGENLVVEGLDFRNLPVGTRLYAGDVVLEMTQIGKECHSHCAIYHRMGECIMPREGVFAQVTEGGVIRPGMEMRAELPDADRPFTAAVVTVSDKGFRGERVDESGPAAAQILEEAGYRVVETVIVPDEPARLKTQLIRLSEGRQVDLVVTSGGTGFSLRDQTPEATMAVAERVAPGIAEYLRMKSMEVTERGMLSRGVAVIRRGTLIVNLPGSPKAVRESLGWILGALEHGLGILRGSVTECAPGSALKEGE